MNPLRYGTQGKLYGGNGRESENGSMNLANHVICNKKGHICRYTYLLIEYYEPFKEDYLCAHINTIIL
jgi:hypothetical protein